MRKIIIAIWLGIAITACTSIDCPLNNVVYMNIVMAGEVDTLKDTLSVTIIRHDGTDSVYNRGIKVTSLKLPVSYTGDCDRLVLTTTDTSKVQRVDTVCVYKINTPHFEAVDCSPNYFHEITSVTTTHNAIDSIVLNDSHLNYDTSKEHLYIYFRPHE
jgi:hypothetical protein